MAEEERRDKSNRPQRRDPARGARREPPVIEGQAQDVTPATDAESVINAGGEAIPQPVDVPVDELSPPLQEPTPEVTGEAAVSTPDPEPGPAPPADAGSQAQTAPQGIASESTRDASASRWGVAAVVGFVVLAAGLLYLFAQLSSLPPDNTAAVADIRSRLATLEARPATDAAGVADRLAKLETTVGETRNGLEAVGKRVDALAGTVSAQPNVTRAIADLRAATASLKTDLGAVTASVAAVPRPDIGRLEARIGDIDQRVSGLQGAMSSIPHVDLGPLTRQVDAIETRLKPVEAEAVAARSPEQVAQRRAAPVAVTAQAITGAIEASQAFPKELAALQALGVEPARLAPLQAVADNGAPSLRDLQSTLADLRGRAVTEGAAPARGSYVDRLVAGASSLVQVRPLGTVVGDTPAAIMARMDDEIGNDDLAAALAEWQKLPESSQSVSKALADRVKLRLDAEQAAKGIAADAIGAMAASRG